MLLFDNKGNTRCNNLEKEKITLKSSNKKLLKISKVSSLKLKKNHSNKEDD